MISSYLIPLIIDIIVNALYPASLHSLYLKSDSMRIVSSWKGNMAKTFRCVSLGVWTICLK
jgi:hypothetical protein